MSSEQLPEADRPYTGRGRVLRVKQGYNPNSSSLGSVVFVVPAVLVAAPVLLAAVASLIESRFAAEDAQAAQAAAGDPAGRKEDGR